MSRSVFGPLLAIFIPLVLVALPLGFFLYRSHRPASEVPVTTVSLTSSRPAPLATVRATDPAAASFRQSLADFVREGRAMVRLVGLKPDRDTYRKQLEAVRNVYLHMPDPPASDPTLRAAQQVATGILRRFETGESFVALAQESRRTGMSGPDNWLDQMAVEESAKLGELEKASH